MVTNYGNSLVPATVLQSRPHHPHDAAQLAALPRGPAMGTPTPTPTRIYTGFISIFCVLQQVQIDEEACCSVAQCCEGNTITKVSRSFIHSIIPLSLTLGRLP